MALVFKQQGNELTLHKAGVEAGATPIGNGMWHWWLRKGARRIAGEAPSEKSAKHSIGFNIDLLEKGQTDPSFYIDSGKYLKSSKEMK